MLLLTRLPATQILKGGPQSGRTDWAHFWGKDMKFSCLFMLGGHCRSSDAPACPETSRNPRAAINPGQGAQRRGGCSCRAGKLVAQLCVSQHRQNSVHSMTTPALLSLCVFWDTEHWKMVKLTRAVHSLCKWNAVYVALRVIMAHCGTYV